MFALQMLKAPVLIRHTLIIDMHPLTNKSEVAPQHAFFILMCLLSHVELRFLACTQWILDVASTVALPEWSSMDFQGVTSRMAELY